jgi:hypothetical protein
MGKWLSKVLEKELIPDKKIEGYLENNTDKTDRMPEPIVVPVDVSPSMPHLTDVEQEAFQEYIEIMTSSRFNLPRDRAEIKAFELVTKSRRGLQPHQAARDYKLDGFIKIYSVVLKQNIYLAKNERTAKKVPDQSLAVFTEAELECLQGLKKDEAKTIMEVKIEFDGCIKLKQDEHHGK